VLATLERAGTKSHREGHARYGIVAPKAFGVKMGEIQKLAKGYGKSHVLAKGLWASGWYEARMMAAYVDEVEKVTAAQMDQWCEEFADWSVCDTVCFALFDRTPFAFAKIKQWHTRDEEFVKRAAFALLASVALHREDARGGDQARCEASRVDGCHRAMDRQGHREGSRAAARDRKGREEGRESYACFFARYSRSSASTPVTTFLGPALRASASSTISTIIPA